MIEASEDDGKERSMTDDVSTAIDTAAETLGRLQQKRAGFVARVAEISHERQAIGFAVHSDGDPKARKRLDALYHEAVSVDGELLSLDAAITEAQRRLTAARRDEAAEHNVLEGSVERWAAPVFICRSRSKTSRRGSWFVHFPESRANLNGAAMLLVFVFGLFLVALFFWVAASSADEQQQRERRRRYREALRRDLDLKRGRHLYD
jgi:hypothetical protein